MYQIVVWEKDIPPPREWVLENAKGASGICVMMADKVDDSLLDAGKYRYLLHTDMLLRVTPFAPAGPSLKVVSTFSVGYGKFHCSLTSLVDLMSIDHCHKQIISIWQQ